MPKLVLDDVLNITTATATLNSNSAKIEAAFENTLSRNGTTPNQMNADLDMNGNDVLNIGDLVVDGVRLTTLIDDAAIATAAASSATASAAAALASETIAVAAAASASSVTGIPTTVGQDNRVLKVDGASLGWETQTSDDVTFTPAGTGAVASTVQAKLREFRSVRDYGAKAIGETGADATENTTAFQAAINAANAAGGGAVYIPGKFALDGGLVLKGGVSLIGQAGQAERLSSSNPTDAAIVFSGTGYDGITVGVSGETSGAMSASIKGLSIFNAPQSGIVVESYACTIEGVAVTHPVDNGIVVNVGVCEITRTHVIGPGGHGIVLNAGDNRIQNTEVQQPNNTDNGGSATINTKDCILVTSGPQQIIQCRMGDDAYRNRHGIHVSGNAAIQVSNCDIQNNTQSSIHIAGGNSHIITGNKIISSSTNASKAGIHLATDATLSVITGNYLNATITGGLGGIYIATAQTGVSIRANSMVGNWAGDLRIVFPTEADRALSTGCWFEYGLVKQGGRYALELSGATPSVDNGAAVDVFWLVNASATTVTNFLNGYPGQEITLLATDANTTIAHNSSYIRLLNAQDWKMSAYSVLKLKKATGQKTFGAIWYETGRMNGQHAAGASNGGLSVGGQVGIYSNSGSPETAITAVVGSLYLQTDGGYGTALYIKGNGTSNTGWIPFAGLSGSATYDPAELVDGAGETTSVTVTGAAVGDFAEASFSNDLQGITVTAWVSAANTVSVRFQNESGGTLNLGSGTLRARVRKA